MTKIKTTITILFAVATATLSCNAAHAQGAASMGSNGSTFSNGVTGFQSGQSPIGNPNVAPTGHTYTTGAQSGGSGPNLSPVGTPGGAPGGPGPTLGLNGSGYAAGSLPPTTLDSFVYNSGYDDTVYGDEGSYGPPPYYDFDTIGSGMGSYGGLSTGHASSLPSSWGYTSGTY